MTAMGTVCPEVMLYQGTGSGSRFLEEHGSTKKLPFFTCGNDGDKDLMSSQQTGGLARNAGLFQRSCRFWGTACQFDRLVDDLLQAQFPRESDTTVRRGWLCYCKLEPILIQLEYSKGSSELQYR